MMQRLPTFFCLLALAACAQAVPESRPEAPGADVGEDMVAEGGRLRPKARPASLSGTSTSTSAPRPPRGARTVAQFDTTSKAERAAATAPPKPTGSAGGEKKLGRTIASLGSPTEPGFWLKTPLVDDPTPGRAVYTANGKSVKVDLIPIDGPATAGSRMSLPALRLLDAPLAGLPELEVFALPKP